MMLLHNLKAIIGIKLKKDQSEHLRNLESLPESGIYVWIKRQF